VPIRKKILDCFKGSSPNQNKAQNPRAALRICEYEGPAERGICQKSLNVGGLSDPRPEIIRRKSREDNDPQDHRSENRRD
jgi:hypothetical protein